MNKNIKKVNPITPLKKISILGSTGSIGQSTIQVIASRQEDYEIIALTANCNVDLLAKQAIELNAKIAVIADETKYEELKDKLSNTKIEAAAGVKAIEDAAAENTDFVVAGIIGAAGLRPTLKSIQHSKKVGIANKECFVCAGDIINKLSLKYGSQIIPIDSEHNSIFQIFDYENPTQVEKITLTASGGPFYNHSLDQMINITPEQAIKHPNWSMGAKISVDSATLMNKGLELIEAFYLFPVKEEQIEIIIHPESIIHGLVHYIDGSVLAGMSNPDMKVPISYALDWPKRNTNTSCIKLDLAKIGRLTFLEPDLGKFPSINIARAALKTGGTATTALNAVNEIAVNSFLKNEIKFLSIMHIIEKCMNQINFNAISTIEDVFIADSKARLLANTLIKNAG